MYLEGHAEGSTTDMLVTKIKYQRCQSNALQILARPMMALADTNGFFTRAFRLSKRVISILCPGQIAQLTAALVPIPGCSLQKSAIVSWMPVRSIVRSGDFHLAIPPASGIARG